MVNIFDKVLGSEDDLEVSPSELEKRETVKVKFNWNNLILPSLIFLIAIIVRLLYTFVFSNPNFPGWYTDVFHHWQIAYLSKEIGFHQGFLRLWDFKGMEFFWGLLHPLVLVILFSITGSISIIIPRLLSIFGGSLSIALLFILIKRHFNQKTAIAVSLFAIFFPITIFSNSAGMQEELGMPLILGALIAFPSYPIVSGVFLSFASMVRAEYWIFSFGLILASLFLRKNMDKVILMVISYLIPIVFYMKYLINWTGSFIFPIKLNFFASVRGDWFEDLPIIGAKLIAKRISQGIFGFGVLGALITLIKKPKASLFLLFGFGNIIFIGFMIGFGAYVKGYIPRFWVDRLYNWPYLFTAILIIIFLFYWIPNKFQKLKVTSEVFAWLILAFGILISQLIWKPINFFMQPVEEIYNSEKLQAKDIANYYEGGGILLPEDRPYITYFLAHDYKIEGKNMVGQMFDPFFYFTNKEEPFNNWGEDREVVINWLEKNDIKLIVLTTNKPTYLGLIEREPDLFTKLPSESVKLYRFK